MAWAKEPGMVALTLLAILAAWIEEKPIDSNIRTEDIERFSQKTVEIICLGKSAWC